MTPHIAQARRAATHLLWAACAGGLAEETIEIMKIAMKLWPDGELMLGKGSPLADSPSARSWRNAMSHLIAAKDAQALAMNIDWEQRAKAEALADQCLQRTATEMETEGGDANS